MAEYTVKDEETGKTITFNWEGDTDPTDDDFSNVFAEARNYESYKGQQSIPQQVGESVKKTIGNIPRSAGEMVSGLYQAVRHPVDTATALGKTAMGGVSKLYGGGSENEQYWDAMTGFFKERYGGLDNLKNTIETDPVGFAADISTFLGGAGLATKVGTAGKMGQGLIKAGRAIDPLTLGMRGIQGTANTIGKAAGQVAGLTTGKGYYLGKKALESSGTENYTNALRGKTELLDILDEMKTSFGELKKQKWADQQGRLEQLSKNKTPIDMGKIENEIDNLLSTKYKLTKNPDGSYDWLHSLFVEDQHMPVQKIIDTIRDWSASPGHNTPMGLHDLKLKISDYYKPQTHQGGLVNDIENSIKQTISKEVPEYKNMLKASHEDVQLLEAIQDATKLDKKSIDTLIGRLNTMMKGGNDYRLKMLDILSKHGDTDLLAQLAGAAFNPWVPSGGFGRVVTGTGVLGSLTSGAVGSGALLGAFLPLIAMGSPRLVGEFINILGYGKKGMKAVQKATPPLTGNILYQAGRAKQQSSLYRNKQ